MSTRVAGKTDLLKLFDNLDGVRVVLAMVSLIASDSNSLVRSVSISVV